MALSQSDSIVLHDNGGFPESAVATTTEQQATVFQYLDELLAAQPHFLPAIRNYVEDKEHELAESTTSPRKRKRGAREGSTYLGELFDSLAPSPSSRIILRPLKMATTSNDAFTCESGATGISLGNESDLENAPLSVTEPLEKQMELSFGVVPNKSALSFPQRPKRKRLDSDDGNKDGDKGKSKNEDPVTKQAKKPKKTGRLETVHKSLTFEWDMDGSNINLAEICPFSLYPNSSCTWGSSCRMKSICAGKPCKELPCTKEHLRWTCGFLIRRERCPDGTGCLYGHDQVEQRLASYARGSDHVRTGR